MKLQKRAGARKLKRWWGRRQRKASGLEGVQGRVYESEDDKGEGGRSENLGGHNRTNETGRSHRGGPVLVEPQHEQAVELAERVLTGSSGQRRKRITPLRLLETGERDMLKGKRGGRTCRLNGAGAAKT